MEVLGAIGFFLLLAHLFAHVALVLAVGREKPAHGALAFVFPPLGLVWGWEAGAKKRVIAYGATLLAFGAVVTVLVYAR